jgi:lipoyl(octanoyl) transferase
VSELRVVRAGTVPYEQAWQHQRTVHTGVVDGS